MTQDAQPAQYWCRGCQSHQRMTIRLDLGEQRLSGFGPAGYRPPWAPLTLGTCNRCRLAQLLGREVARADLYRADYGYRSGTNPAIVANLQQAVDDGLARNPGALAWLDIGCNDGTLLSLVPERIARFGVDPVEKYAREAAQYAHGISIGFFSPEVFPGARYDVVTAISMFYDVPDPTQFCRDVASVLAPGGVWIVQQNYLQAMLSNGSFDNICHEHLTYFSVQTLQGVLARAGLRILSVERDPVNGGSIRTAVVHESDPRPSEPSLALALAHEHATGRPDDHAWHEFHARTYQTVRHLRQAVHREFARGGEVMIYGASTRGAVIWQACGFGPGDIAAAVERQPEKVGLCYSPLGDIPIISEEQARLERPSLMLVGPWWHKNSMVEREIEYLRAGGRMLFPLPEPTLVQADPRSGTIMERTGDDATWRAI